MKRFSLHITSLLLLLFVAVSIAGCDSNLLNVENLDDPDTQRALDSPQDLRELVRSSYTTYWDVTHKSYPAMPLSVAAGEGSASWGNWGMQDAGTIPRPAFNNSTSYTYRGWVQTPWYTLFEGISSANDGLEAIRQRNLEIVVGGTDETAKVETFAKFVQGLNYAYLAAFFDRAPIVDEFTDIEAGIVDNSPYEDVHAFAVAALEEAIELAEQNTFELSGNWINNRPLTNVELAQLARTELARYLAYTPRTPAERTSVDWNYVLDLLDEGITESFTVEGDGGIVWWDRMKINGHFPGWMRASYDLIGPADESGSYEDWLSTPASQRQPFILDTPDKRIQGGLEEGTPTPGKYISFSGSPPHPEDRGTYFWSFYSFSRYDSFHSGDPAYSGPVMHIEMSEVRMLRAEALLRTGGSLDEVADLINETRVTNGEMSPVSAANGAGSSTDAQSAAADASLWSLLKHEKRMETFHSSAGIAFFDKRGWGDLVSGTPVQFPVPARELETLSLPVYTFGGGGEGSAP